MPPLLLLGLVGLFSAPLLGLAERMEVDFEALINIEYEEGQPLPSNVTKYDGKEVTVKGFMHNSTEEGTNTFLLVTDGCGCDGEVKVFHYIEVDLGSDTIGYKPDLLTITGTMEVGEVKEDGYVVSVYRLRAEDVN